MQRLLTGFLICFTTLMLAACAKQEPAVPAAETNTAQAEPVDTTPAADSAPTTATETVVVVEEKPATTPPPAAASEPEIKTAARPSLLLELMLEPIQFALLSTMQSMQEVVKPLANGNIPGLPAASAKEDGAPKSEQPQATPPETPAEPANDTANEPTNSEPTPE